MQQIKEEIERFPEVEKRIIELLESKKGLSDYSTLQNLLPNVSDKEFFISTHFLIEDGKIKDGSLEKIKTLVQWDKNTLVEAPALSRLIMLVKE
ncbi:hypothetical protein KAT63_02440 [Candidatus Parcubacteria bacterium]|nr:hypothetical protein [Candidatus Parcubacteria bacterium]